MPIDDRDTAERKIEKADRIVESIERIFIVICVAVILMFIFWQFTETSSGFGSIVLIGGIALIIVLAMVEVLLIEKHRHQQ